MDPFNVLQPGSQPEPMSVEPAAPSRGKKRAAEEPLEKEKAAKKRKVDDTSNKVLSTTHKEAPKARIFFQATRKGSQLPSDTAFLLKSSAEACVADPQKALAFVQPKEGSSQRLAFFLEHTTPTVEVAVFLLEAIIASKIECEDRELAKIVSIATPTIDNMLETMVPHMSDVELLSKILLSIEGRKSESLLKRCVYLLYEAGKMNVASELVQSILPELKKRRVTPGFVEQTLETAKFLSMYAWWSATSYSSKERFSYEHFPFYKQYKEMQEAFKEPYLDKITVKALGTVVSGEMHRLWRETQYFAKSGEKKEQLLQFFTQQIQTKFNKVISSKDELKSCLENVIGNQISQIAGIPQRIRESLQAQIVQSLNVDKIYGCIEGQKQKTLQGSREVMEEVHNIISSHVENLEENINWLIDRKLSIELASVPEFVDFLKKTNIHSNAKFYGHPIGFGEEGAPSILVQGERVPFEHFQKFFTLEEDPVIGASILEKATGKRWYYLEKGLVPHDPRKEIVPLRTLDRSKEKNPQYEVIFLQASDGNTNSAQGIQRFSRHSWVNLCTPDGKLYSVGKLSTHKVISPDIFEFLPHAKTKVSFSIPKETFVLIMNEMQKKQQEDPTSFNFLNNNCSTFAAQVASTLFPNITAATPVAGFDTLETRIKFFVASQMFAEYISTQKPALFEEIVSKTPGSGEVLSFFVNKIVKNGIPQEHLSMVLQAAQYMSQDPELLKSMEISIVDFLKQVKDTPQKVIVVRTFNLLHDILNTFRRVTIDCPDTLTATLKTMKGARTTEYKRIV